jgi:predicted dehydrogenase
MSSKYTWGIIGAGNIAGQFVSDLALLPGAHIRAIGSKSSERGKAFASRHDIPVFCSYENLFSDPEVDIVYIASRHVDHYHHTVEALQHGKAVLCEKPATMNRKQFDRITEIAGANNLFYMEALWTRFLPSFIKCGELLQQGAIGDIQLIEADFCFNPPFNPEGRLFNLPLGGGALLDIGLYPLFFALEHGGPVEEVKTNATLLKNGIDVTTSLLLRHKGGIQSVLFCSFMTTGRNEAIIHGSKGILRLNSMWHTPTSIDIISINGTSEHFAFEVQGNGYQYEASEVMKCLAGKKHMSPLWSWNHSAALSTLLDTIRQQAGIVYPHPLEAI